MFKKKKITYEEAKQRFIEQGRNDIELIEEGFKGWRKKSLFFHKELNKTWEAIPDNVFRRSQSHPDIQKIKFLEKKRIPYIEAVKKFKHRNDIKLCEEEYISFNKLAKFWDFVEQDYFHASPKIVYYYNSCHPNRARKNGIKLRTLSFEEAEIRFKEREDIKLIKEGYSGFHKKSKFYDKEFKEYFDAIPDNVFRRKSCHPKRKTISKNQIKLFNSLKEIFIKNKISLEQQNVYFNKNYVADIFFSEYNIIIEYNGDYWHCNPNVYNGDYFHKRSKKFAKEIWEYDKRRKEELERTGYKILIVWEYDYKNNKETTLNNLKKDIVNIIEERKNFKQS